LMLTRPTVFLFSNCTSRAQQTLDNHTNAPYRTTDRFMDDAGSMTRRAPHGSMPPVLCNCEPYPFE
jgi:hypothetical protein